MTEDAATDFASYGAQLFKGALKPCLQTIEAALSTLRQGEAGLRLHGIEALRPALAHDGCVGVVAASILGASAKPVRAVLFNKSPGSELVARLASRPHNLRAGKMRGPGFGPWTVKSGLIHVAPPFDVLTRMVTLRAHLDDVPTTNAPLLISPGSHLDGRVTVDDIEKVVALRGTAACVAEAGDIWLYATPILHASDKAAIPASRRVLQVDYAAEELPGGLEWLGV